MLLCHVGWSVPQAQEHPAFLSSPSHLDRYVSRQNHHVSAVSSQSVWRSTPLTSRRTAPRGSCTEVSQLAGLCHLDVCTEHDGGSPPWQRGSPKTWRNSAYFFFFITQRYEKEKAKLMHFPLALYNPDRKDAVLRGAGGRHWLLTTSNCSVCVRLSRRSTGEPTSAGDAGDAVTSPSSKQLLNVLTCT